MSHHLAAMEETETTTSTSETVTTVTLDAEMPEVKLVDEKHTTTLEISPTFTKPLLPAIQADEGGTVQ